LLSKEGLLSLVGLTKRPGPWDSAALFVIRVYDAAGKVIETHERAGDFQRAVKSMKRVAVVFQWQKKLG
jgi:hypothetical protein